ncbi:TPA: hypothetical protein ACQGUY_006332 [Pseudomonas aeruginosa]|uniref:hypothetical protein n=1 Tax=Pseudomonas aeruginosa TaxID=287 RepID=UPI000F5247C5|nr:hypothetical protein [Pseudomonas aeruginosa]EIU2643150.1 hypothetical protein [Pseudomonas aeruginosa]EIU4985882.1 hypothetical protein [Pseudomonas aeruginosa]EIU9544667.1 hypothetical protein [Pseudomonas aeruginosa]EIU9551462.1 hypothetical protein [Pseudomonas aeruginosa]EIY2515453.1 hypothetical protein [Pseudomonas aeruginosa]
MKLSSLFPEEIINALKAKTELNEVASLSSSPARAIILNGVIMALGFLAAIISFDAIDKDLLESISTFCGVMIGFVITSMLFSGRSEHADGLSLEQARAYIWKAKYMLLSQINTLFSYIFCLAFCMAALFCLKMDMLLSQKILAATAISFLSMSIYRTVLLPFQIYDVHSFSLDSLLEEKRSEAAAQSREASKARILKLTEKK